MSQDLGLNPNDLITQPLPSEGPGIPKHVEEYTKLLARCFLKQGEWQILLNNNWRTETSEIILGAYLLATHFDDKWYKAWHNWALANFEVISLFTSQNNNGNNGTINVSQGEIINKKMIKLLHHLMNNLNSHRDRYNLQILYRWMLFSDMLFHQ